MKRITVMLVLGALVAVTGSSLVTQAATCGNTARTKTDKFGSCETSSGSVRCGTGTDAQVGTVIVKDTESMKGVQACATDSQPLPISGRVGAYQDASGLHVFIDGGDAENDSGAKGWQRYDIGSDNVCARRGSGGTYYDGKRGGAGSSNADANVNHKISPDGVSDCQ